MKIAVTSQNRETVTGHAGHCRTFWVFEIDACEVKHQELVELAMGESLHAGRPAPLDQINVLITGSLGNHLRNRLKQQGIVAVATEEADPVRAVRGWLDDTLRELPPGLSAGHCACH
ncbi:MAG: NifB/NifX family molybdenum-iron cluster-binding protein [Pseudomonadota bacterium]